MYVYASLFLVLFSPPLYFWFYFLRYLSTRVECFSFSYLLLVLRIPFQTTWLKCAERKSFIGVKVHLLYGLRYIILWNMKNSILIFFRTFSPPSFYMLKFWNLEIQWDNLWCQPRHGRARQAFKNWTFNQIKITRVRKRGAWPGAQ